MDGATEARHPSRGFAIAFSVITLGAVAAPLAYGRDDFPLSNYPMFSYAREPVAKVYHVVGFSEVGNHRPVPLAALGTDEIMQGWQTVKLAARRGGAGAPRLCDRAARYVAERDAYDDLSRLEVRIDWFDTIAYWKGERRPQRTRVVFRCEVPRESRG